MLLTQTSRTGLDAITLEVPDSVIANSIVQLLNIACTATHMIAKKRQTSYFIAVEEVAGEHGLSDTLKEMLTRYPDAVFSLNGFEVHPDFVEFETEG